MGQLRNPHPGEILKEEFLNEIGVSQTNWLKQLSLNWCGRASISRRSRAAM
jgi:plasmid maintenance system antidote protein VapI